MPLRLSIVVPAFNESARIVSSLHKIRQFLLEERLDSEILVVNDGSTDDTVQAVRSQMPAFKSVTSLRVLENPGNHGKGYSVRHGVLQSTGAQVLFSDADLSCPIEDYRKLAVHLANGAAIAFGSRALKRSEVRIHQPKAREYSGRVFNLLVRAVTGLPFRDTQCGFKLFTREAADAVFSRQTVEGFGFDVEILYIARKLGFNIAEVPVVWENVEGSRVSFAKGMRAFLDVLGVRYQDFSGAYDNGGKKST
jgi:glycosyltransferase involved in cell wall biosynthesis